MIKINPDKIIVAEPIIATPEPTKEQLLAELQAIREKIEALG